MSNHPICRAGQATVEHGLFLGIVIGALIALQVFVTRGLNARYKSLVDGTTTALGSSGQYEPYYANSESTVANYSAVTTEYKPGGEVVRRDRSRQMTESGWQRSQQDLKADDGWD